VRPVLEAASPHGAEQRVALQAEGGHDDVRPPIVVVILGIDTHPREAAPVVVVRDGRFQRDFDECALTGVSEKVLAHRVVGHEDVDPTVAVEIVNGDAERLSRMGADAARRRDIAERAITIVA